jgi:hypothetical protein
MANWRFYRNLLFPCCSSGQGEPLGLQQTDILPYFRCFHPSPRERSTTRNGGGRSGVSGGQASQAQVEGRPARALERAKPKVALGR